ncbi:hypothetical protein C819_02615 [Lachnospiraceae bacterium 10-1]|jgi:hypothetical protein|nr:hypothetical protein C819_02615 [Lachnospiraceae bacterium 10-1]
MGYVDEIVDLQQQMKNYIDRLNTGKLSRKDSGLIVQVAGSYYESLEEYKKQEHATLDDKFNDILSEIINFQDGIIQADNQAVRAAYEKFSNTAEVMTLENQKLELMMQTFKTDLEEMNLHDMKLRLMQDFVNIDLKLYGSITEKTLEVLEVQKCELVNNLVQEKKYMANEKDIKKEPEQSYKANVYMKNSSTKKQIPKVIYGNSPEDIITTLQGWNMGRIDAIKFRTCYISKLNPDTNKYQNLAKYDVSTGVDITPIYLNIPHMGRNKFLKTIEQLKKNGARYNPVQKQFYVTKQLDLNKFSDYLPIVGTQAEIRESKTSSESRLSYEIESGQEYYDNRVLVTVEGMEPFNIYGDKFDVHFPSLSAKETREIIEKFVLPELEINRTERNIPKEIQYNGQKYNALQYNILELAISQNFSKEQMALIERPELTSDRMNEIRFAVRDGLSAEQILLFATPAHEQWQMDLCRTGMQHGMTYEELKPVISPSGYIPELYGERRSQLSQMIKAKEKDLNALQKPGKASESIQSEKDNKSSVLSKLGQNKAKLEFGQTKCEHAMQHKEKMETER